MTEFRDKASLRAILLTQWHVVSCFLNAVGVADKDIVPNGKMTASSIYRDDSFAYYARLNGNKGYGWCSDDCCENDEWLQVDIGRTVEIYVVSLPKDLREDNIGLKILNFHILPMEAVGLPIRTQKELKW